MVQPISGTAARLRVKTVSIPGAVRRKLLDWIAARREHGEFRLPPERILAQELQVSRTTLREALRSLSDNGVIAPRQGSGWYIREDSAPVADGLAVHFRFREMSLAQLIEARNIIEPPIAGLAAERRTGADLAELERIYAGMLEAAADLDRFEQLDQEFHRGLGEASQNPFFVVAVQPLLTLLREKRIGVLHRRGVEASNREHARVLKAIQDADPEAARTAMRAHLSSWIRRMGDAQTAANDIG